MPLVTYQGPAAGLSPKYGILDDDGTWFQALTVTGVRETHTGSAPR